LRRVPQLQRLFAELYRFALALPQLVLNTENFLCLPWLPFAKLKGISRGNPQMPPGVDGTQNQLEFSFNAQHVWDRSFVRPIWMNTTVRNFRADAATFYAWTAADSRQTLTSMNTN
jgi:hypothetical protein